jgi:Leucine-rich repeat (LRR) protein
MDGSAYAYTKLTLPNKGITAVTEIIVDYPHLRQIDLSSNQISDLIHVQKLKFITHLNLSRNVLSDGKFLYNPALFANLKSLNLSSNKFKALPSIELPRLLSLSLNNNEIESL